MHRIDPGSLLQRWPTPPRTRRRGHIPPVLLGLLFVAIPALGQITLEAQVLGGGGGRSTSAGGCIVLDATFGQGAAGVTSSGNFSILAGYWARVDNASRDSLFNSGFEGCQ